MVKLPDRKRLGLTWLDLVVNVKERAAFAPGVKCRVASARVGDGSLYVVVIAPPPPLGAPLDSRGPIAIHVTHTAGKGRTPTIAELDEVVYHFARDRVMALLFSGAGIPTGPAYYELVEVTGAVMPQGGLMLTPPSA